MTPQVSPAKAYATAKNGAEEGRQPIAVCIDGTVFLDDGGWYWPATEIGLLSRKATLLSYPIDPLFSACLAEIAAAETQARKYERQAA